jgi:type 1 glutamine amidotransferase
MRLVLLLLMLCSVSCARAADPKRLLLVTTTTGYRHSSIEVGEKVIRELAAKSGEFTVVSTSESRSYPDYRIAQSGPALRERVRRILAEYLSPAALAGYDGVLFLSPVDEAEAALPLPDRAALYAWIAAGHGFIGVRAASDCLHQDPAYAALLGGEFAGHGRQAAAEVRNFDPAHPATAAWGGSVRLFEELYHFRPNYDRTKVRSLLSLTTRPDDGSGRPGESVWMPLAWAKSHGSGRVFYTALGHREDLWDPGWRDPAGNRANPPAVAEAFQQHLLGGIRWALGLVPGDVTPQAVP